MNFANWSLFAACVLCDIWLMKNLLSTIAVLIILPLAALASESGQKLYRWVDSEGVVHYGDSIPAEFTDLERQIVNDHGITVGVMRAKRTAEEIAEDERQEDLRQARKMQRRQDMALLATYLSVDEILLQRSPCGIVSGAVPRDGTLPEQSQTPAGYVARGSVTIPALQYRS